MTRRLATVTLVVPDYDAAIAYWTLAYGSGGSFMAVSRDWP